MKKISMVIIVILSLIFSGILFANENLSVKSGDDVSISYQITGGGDISLVFIHCWCGNSSFWKNQVPKFSNKFQVVTLDLAGHGKSGMNRKNYSIHAFAQDVSTVVKKLNLEDVILIGHSMGGPVMIETAGLIPNRVKALIAVDTLHNVEQRWPEAQFNQLITAMKKDFKNTSAAFIKSMFPPNADKKVVGDVVNTICSTKPEVGIGSMEALYNFKLTKAMDKIEIPIYCINSALYPTDTKIGAEHALSFKAKIIKNVGHFLQLEKPEAFNRALNDVLKELIKK